MCPLIGNMEPDPPIPLFQYEALAAPWSMEKENGSLFKLAAKPVPVFTDKPNGILWTAQLQSLLPQRSLTRRLTALCAAGVDSDK